MVTLRVSAHTIISTTRRLTSNTTSNWLRCRTLTITLSLSTPWPWELTILLTTRALSKIWRFPGHPAPRASNWPIRTSFMPQRLSCVGLYQASFNSLMAASTNLPKSVNPNPITTVPMLHWRPSSNLLHFSLLSGITEWANLNNSINFFHIPDNHGSLFKH